MLDHSTVVARSPIIIVHLKQTTKGYKNMFKLEVKNSSQTERFHLLVFGSGVSGKNSRFTGAKLHGVVGADELPLLKPLLLPKFS